MFPSLETNTDKTIVIGLTGPLASGCTTLSKFFADEPHEGISGINDFLKENDYVHDNELNYEVFNEHIKDLYDKKNDLEIIIKSITDNIEKDSKLVELTSIYTDLKLLLEKREYTNSLDYLLDNNNYKNRLRISCSSVIIFHLVKDLKKLESYTSIPDDKIEKISNFYDTLTSIISKYNIDINLFIKVFNNIIDIFHHKKPELKYTEPPFSTTEIDKCFTDVALIKQSLSNLNIYREIMQDLGDNLRCSGNPFDYNNREWIQFNKSDFVANNDIIAKYIDYIIHFYSNSQKQIRLFIIDSFRNPMCIYYLRKRYSRFYLVSILSSIDKRMERYRKTLEKKGLPFNQEDFEKEDGRDKGDFIKKTYEKFYMQNVDKVVQLSDIAINNNKDKNRLFDSILRYLALIFDPGCTKPTGDEMFMNMAYSMAMKSNCISRQVGAVIEGKNGYVVGAGWNDVGEGQISCGLRIINDLSYGQYDPLIRAINEKSNEQKLSIDIIRDMVDNYGRKHYCFCFKDKLTNAIMKKEIKHVFDSMKLSKQFQEMENKDCIDAIHKKVEREVAFKGLQYCKALHAEENAIIQGSKIGGMGLVGGKLYTTTFPCELCAKKIQQVGIDEVIYVEPYPKNISEDIYLQDGIKKVKTRQFEGVKGIGYYKLFNSFYDQKDWQSLERDGFVD